jgi:hypothetical protein
MAMPNTTMYVPRSAQEGLIIFNNSCLGQQQQDTNLRDTMQAIDIAYAREENLTKEHARAKLANKYGDANKLQDITVPVVMPQVESATAYQSSVFLSGLPIFESVANPEFEDEALQLNTIIEDQSIRGGWVRELQMFIRDGFKYNISAIEVGWDSVVTAAVETDLTFDSKYAKPKAIQWEGNIIKRLDMYNTIFDARCAPTDIPTKGEFAGYVDFMSRTALKTFINKLPNKIIENVTAAFESSITSNGTSAVGSYFIPTINNSPLVQRNAASGYNWMVWAGVAGAKQNINYSNMYEVTTLYGRIIPSDFGLKVPAANTPQVWKLIYVNNKVLIFAERQTNAHDNIPILFGVPYEDGLKYQTKSLATNAMPFQQASSALLNQSFAASRRSIWDRTVYDPSRIREADINNPNPASKIPVRPAAYGKPVTDSFQQMPFRDDQSGIVFEKMQQLATMTDEATGRNRAQRGLFTKGNRTKEEYNDVMGNAGGRDHMVSMLLEAQVFTPMKEILKINILQYQGGTTLYSASTQQSVAIDPVALRKAVLNFKMADGLSPVSKQINSDTLQVAMQTIASNPTIAAGYNLGPAFSYLMKTQGADLKPFEKSQQQVAYEQAMGQWQQTIQTITDAAVKLKQELDPKSLPPQPTPEQFGYTPGSTSQTQQQPQKQPTIMEQIMAKTQQPQQSTIGAA